MALYEFAGAGEAEQTVLARIEELRRELRFHLYEPRRWVGSLRRLNFARNIQGSNSIEGIEASIDDVLDVAVGDTPVDADEETAAALAGYRQAMTYVLALAGDEQFVYEAGVIRALHFMIAGHDLQTRPGQWRVGPIYVRDEATGDVVYEGPEPEAVPGLVDELVAVLRQPSGHHPIVAAAMAHLNLVKIHPFRDGNGRMSRCLQTLVLAREGTADAVFSSIEEYLGHHTKEYYDVLGEVGGRRYSPERDPRDWVRFCLTAHLRSGIQLRRRIRETEALWGLLEDAAAEHHLPDRVLMALADASEGLRVRNSTYRNVLANAAGEDISDQAASRDLRALVAAGLLEPHGAARGRSYRASPTLRAIRAQVRLTRDPAEDADPFAPTTRTGKRQPRRSSVENA
jgi:Fic family protein